MFTVPPFLVRFLISKITVVTPDVAFAPRTSQGWRPEHGFHRGTTLLASRMYEIRSNGYLSTMGPPPRPEAMVAVSTYRGTVSVSSHS